MGKNGQTFSKLLFPDKDEKAILQKWDRYWQLRATVNVALIYSVIFIFIGLPAWLIGDQTFADAALILMTTAVLGSGITFASVYLADLSVNEAFLENSGPR